MPPLIASLVSSHRLAYKPPLDWRYVLRFFRSHPLQQLERVDGDAYERVFRLGGKVGWFKVTPAARTPHVNVRILCPDPAVRPGILSRVRRMFDLDCDPAAIARGLRTVPLLAALHDQHPGLRLPRGFEPFETAIATILGQLVSTEWAAALVAQLIHAYGEKVPHPLTGEPVGLFPGPEVLATCILDAVKTTGARKETIRTFSRRVLQGDIVLKRGQDPAALRSALRATRGIGPWSAEYICLRATADTDAFPGTDLILQRVLDAHPTLNVDAVRPWRSYAAILLWKEFAQRLSKKKATS